MTVGACVAAYDEHNEKTVFKHEHGVKALAHGAAGSQGTYGAAASRGKGSGSCSSARPPSRKGNHSSSSAHIDPYCITAPQRRSTLSCLPACHLFSVAPKRGSPLLSYLHRCILFGATAFIVRAHGSVLRHRAKETMQPCLIDLHAISLSPAAHGDGVVCEPKW